MVKKKLFPVCRGDHPHFQEPSLEQLVLVGCQIRYGAGSRIPPPQGGFHLHLFFQTNNWRWIGICALLSVSFSGSSWRLFGWECCELCHFLFRLHHFHFAHHFHLHRFHSAHHLLLFLCYCHSYYHSCHTTYLRQRGRPGVTSGAAGIVGSDTAVLETAPDFVVVDENSESAVGENRQRPAA